tara:strand:- start:1807 stop:2661 length:855 start_codon:yes stop_codon:yes gene_type:complete
MIKNPYSAKPVRITATGEVIFTNQDYLEVKANQVQCEAYGYTYDKVSGTCIAFRNNTHLERNLSNINNKINGAGNTTERGTNIVQINGTNNTTKGFNNNCFINGSNNEIATLVRESMVVGMRGQATSNSSLVLTGNALPDALGERQNITIMWGAETTNGTTLEATISNTASTDDSVRYFEVPTNTIVVFQTETVGVRTGGTAAGSDGDFKAFIETGAAINKMGVVTVDKGRTTIANTGSMAGVICSVDASTKYLLQTVKGNNNKTIKWVTTMRLTQLKTLNATL